MHKEPARHFDAHAWAHTCLHDAPRLLPDTLRIVAGFTLMWNLFEDIACDRRASVDKLDRIASRLESSPTLSRDEVAQSISFYRARYVKDNAFQERFIGLSFRQQDRRKLVEAVLMGDNTSLRKTLLALLIIAFRIRNNLFHGLKSVRMWDDQAQNISEASRILSIALEAHDADVVKRRPTT